MIFMGYPAHQVIAANRVATVGLASAGYYKFEKKGLIDHKIGFFIAIFATIGSYFGARIVVYTDTEILERLIAVVIIVLLILTLLKKDIGLKPKKLSKRHYIIGGIASFFLGIYLGFIGLAGGTFLVYLGVLGFGLTFLKSSGTIKIAGGIASLIASIVFFFNGLIVWDITIALTLGFTIGSYIGAHYSDKIGDIWIRRLFMGICAVMALTLLF